MPYDSNAKLPKSVRDALPEHAQTIYRKTFNSASKQYGTENEARLMKVAWAAVKNVYEKKDDKWVLKEGISAVSDALAIYPHELDPTQSLITGEGESDWIPIATVGQAVQIKDSTNPGLPQQVFPTAEGFEKAVELFNELKQKGYVSKNHSNEHLDGLEVLEQKFEHPFLYAKFNSEGEAAIKDPKSNGRSIDATIFGLEGHLLTDFFVPGVSILDGTHMPACSPQMGCAEVEGTSVKAASIDTAWSFKTKDYTQDQLENACAYVDTSKSKDERVKSDCKLPYKTSEGAIVWHGVHAAMAALLGARGGVDIPAKDRKAVYNKLVAAYRLFDKAPPEYHGGGITKMGEKEGESVTYTGDQMKDRIATAIAETEEKLNNAHEVAVTALKDEQETKTKELETEHAKILKEAGDATTKLEKQIEDELRGEIKAKLGMSDEVAKTLEVFTAEQLNAMKGWTMPVVATAAAGISSVSGRTNEEHEIAERLHKLGIPGIEFKGGEE